MIENHDAERASERDEAPAQRSEGGDILGGEGIGTEETTMGTGAEGDISRGDAGMGAGAGADVADEPGDRGTGGHTGPGGADRSGG